ncbi:MAG: DVUA0089 family protein [Planctomycetota bacterium]
MHHARTNGAARSTTTTRALTCLAVSLAAGMASAQSQMVTSGVQNLSYIGPQVQDFWIPDTPGAQILLTVHGGEGGGAIWGQNNTRGGEGAKVTLLVTIGDRENELRPGGRLRFVVGQKGGTKQANLDAGAGGGGGGTGVIYEADGTGDDWTVLAVAGGGGGGFRGRTYSRAGKNASLGFNGDPGDDAGGNNGNGGVNGYGGEGGTNTQDSAISGGGGGILGDGLVRGGDGGPSSTFRGRKGLPAGGSGGQSQGSGTSGGWGMGGGGSGQDAGSFRSGGGGGGGYSGGGGGAQGRPGGGGGSYGNPAYGTVGASLSDSNVFDGTAAYEFTFIPTPPVSTTNLHGVSLGPSVNINTELSALDTVIGLYNRRGELLAVNDDHSGFTTSRIDADLQPGVYYVSVSDWSNAPRPNFLVESTPSLGGAYNINIGSAQRSGIIPSGGVAWYRFEVGQRPSTVIDAGVANTSGVLADTTLQIDRTPFDMVLGLYDNSGQLLAASDDNADFNIESRIVRKLEPGAYYLSITEFGDFPKPFFTFDTIDNERFGPTIPVKVGSQTVSVPVPANTVGWVRFDVTGAGSSDVTDLGVTHAPGFTIIRTVGLSFNPALTLLSPSGQVLGAAGVGSPMVQPQILTTLGTGTYYAAIAVYPDHVNENFALIPGQGTIGGGTLAATISGSGASMSFSDPITAGQARFYRFEVQTPPPPPCIGDVTTTGATLIGQPGFGVQDGSVDLDDLGYYLNGWVARDAPIADLTSTGATLEGQAGFGVADGSVDLDDLGYFLNFWLAGCQ